MVVVMMVVMSPPPLMVVVMMVVSKLHVIFCSGFFVHRVQERRRVGNWFQQFGKRIRLQSIVKVRRWGSLGHAERRHGAQQSGDRFMHNLSFNFLRRVAKPVGGNAGILEWFPGAARAPGLK
jgi:hypothetical protein